MRKEEADPDTRLAGTQALYNALAFVKKNFDNETERNYIKQTVCETTQAERSDIRLAAYECVVKEAKLSEDIASSACLKAFGECRRESAAPDPASRRRPGDWS